MEAKRMTRARAARVNTEPTTKATRVLTAAAKARIAAASNVTATSGVKTTSAKRKTRADENEGDEDDTEESEPATRTIGNGRTRKTQLTAAAAPVKAARGRPAKKIATEAAREAAVPKVTRGRPRKITEPDIGSREKAGPEKKVARGLSTIVSRSTASSRAAATTKSIVKKSVTFEEPDKENAEPLGKAKATPTPGLRGRPARRGGAACARTTRTNSSTATTKTTETTSTEKKPLSPKKVTQMPLSRVEDSEDELAGEHTPLKLMQKSPVKPPVKKQTEATLPPVTEDETIRVDGAALNPPDFTLTAIITSPARRPPPSPFKEGIKTPAKKLGAISLPTSALQPMSRPDFTVSSPPKNMMLQSAAKRLPSPIKGLQFSSSQKSQQLPPAMKASLLQSPPKRSVPTLITSLTTSQKEHMELSPVTKPLSATASTPAMKPSEKLMLEDATDQSALLQTADDAFDAPISSLQFPGRLSAVLPRHADPALNFSAKKTSLGPEAVLETEEAAVPDEEQQVQEEEVTTSTEAAPEQEELESQDEEIMEIDVAAEVQVTQNLRASADALFSAPTQETNPIYQLRHKDQDSCYSIDSESEDDTSPIKPIAATPATRSSRRSTLSLTSLADQLGAWTAHSPVKSVKAASKRSNAVVKQPSEEAEIFPNQQSPFATAAPLLEDQIVVCPEEQLAQPKVNNVFEEAITDEDLALAQEADGMSLMESDESAEAEDAHRSFDDTLSDASQEYGDENQLPIDPALMGNSTVVPVTPVRYVQKTFHTTTKVPLKPADDSTPTFLKKRSFSAARVGSRRSNGGVERGVKAISYSPLKELQPNTESSPLDPITPSKADIWSKMGTPARAPRKDVNSALLRGAVVFVDVYTSEGADASHVFVELLSLMGARCVKNWTWNPDSEPNAESSASNKVGITHVVYKDGGKRTMKKVRRANGVVHCVGVSWVLDCERENTWVEEGPYAIDTSFVPRGGARRRKSMEPKALSNMNGTLPTSASKGNSTSGQSTPKTPMNRRQSTLWMHTPSDQGDAEGDDDEDIEWSKFILTPVPKTPAPEAIAKYAAELPETPMGQVDVMEEDESTFEEQAQLIRTCPPKANPFRDLSTAALGRDKDDQVLMRLMAARRKSLQFAPKIGSPLSKTWH